MRLRNRNTWKSSWKRKSRRRPWLLITLLLLIGVPIGLELLARAAAQLTGVSEQLTADPTGKSEKVQAYQLGFLSPDRQPYSTLPNQGKLMAVRSPLMGYRLLPQQKNQYWTINAQGFRETDPIPFQKPDGEVRIFILGGSTAFGDLASNNQAIFAGKLEALLNNQVASQKANPTRYQPAILPYRADEVAKALALPAQIPDRKYRVINAAVPGYTSGNELAMLVQQVAAYSPDILIVLDSYPDLLLPSSHDGADIPDLDAALQSKPKSWQTQATEAIGDWFDRLYFVRGVQRYVLQSEPQKEILDRPINLMVPADRSLTQDLATGTELDRRISHYGDNLLQMVRWSAAAKKRLLVGIQPEITGKKADRLTPEESEILSKLGNGYTEQIQASYEKLGATAKEAVKSSPNASLLNLYRLYETFDQRAFQTPTDLTDEANTVLAKRFYEALINQLALEPKPYGSTD